MRFQGPSPRRCQRSSDQKPRCSAEVAVRPPSRCKGQNRARVNIGLGINGKDFPLWSVHNNDNVLQ